MPLQGQLRHQLLQLYVLSPERLNLLLRGVPHHVAGQPLPPCLHELLRPCIVGVGLDPLPPAQVTHRDLPAEPLQHDADLLLRRVLAPTSSLHHPHEGPGLLRPPPLRPLPWLSLSGTSVLLSLKYSTSSRELHLTSYLSGFSIPFCVPLSLTTYRTGTLRARVVQLTRGTSWPRAWAVPPQRWQS